MFPRMAVADTKTIKTAPIVPSVASSTVPSRMDFLSFAAWACSRARVDEKVDCRVSSDVETPPYSPGADMVESCLQWFCCLLAQFLQLPLACFNLDQCLQRCFSFRSSAGPPAA